MNFQKVQVTMTGVTLFPDGGVTLFWRFILTTKRAGKTRLDLRTGVILTPDLEENPGFETL